MANVERIVAHLILSIIKNPRLAAKTLQWVNNPSERSLSEFFAVNFTQNLISSIHAQKKSADRTPLEILSRSGFSLHEVQLRSNL